MNEAITHESDPLAGLDDVKWDKLKHAYGSAEDVPDFLHTVATGDAEAVDELFGNIYHQGTVYDATPHAVPFLARMAVAGMATTELVDLMGLIAETSDDAHAHEDTLPSRCRASVASQVGLIAPLLNSTEDRVRGSVARMLTMCGPAQAVVPLMRARWVVEQASSVRGALLRGLATLDPERGLSLAEDVLDSGNAAERLVAALVCVSNGLPWGTDLSNAAIAWLAEEDQALDFNNNDYWGHNSSNPFMELLLTLAKRGDMAAATQLCVASLCQARGSVPRVQEKVVSAVEELVDNYRVPTTELVAALVPWIEHGPLLGRVLMFMRRIVGAYCATGGTGSRSLVDKLYRMANVRGPDENADAAVDCLIALGYPRAPGLLATDLVNRPRTLRSMVRCSNDGVESMLGFDQVLLDAIRLLLRSSSVMPPFSPGLFSAPPEGSISYNMLMDTLNLLASWGPQAAPALPEIIRMLHYAAFSARVLVSIGDPGSDAITAVRDLCDSDSSDLGSRIVAGKALRDLTGETDSLLAAIRDCLDQKCELGAAAQAAQSLVDNPPEWLIPALEAALPGTGRHSFSPRADIVHALCLFTGHISGLADLLEKSQLSGPIGGYAVFEAARDAGRAAEPLIPELIKFLDSGSFCPPAAEAIMRAGLGDCTLASLADHLVAALEARGRDKHERHALDLLREIRLQDRTAISPDALVQLRELAERPKRVGGGGTPESMIKRDEALRGMIRHFLAEGESG